MIRLLNDQQDCSTSVRFAGSTEGKGPMPTLNQNQALAPKNLGVYWFSMSLLNTVIN